jgi:uncharacterized membrane protein YoaK (UPF0700 family)
MPLQASGVVMSVAALGLSARHRMTDVTTGLYMITAICGLVDAVCFLALGGVFAEMMTGNLLLMAFLIGTGRVLGDATRYVPVLVAFIAGALLGGRLLRGPQKIRERRIGFAVEWLIIVTATLVATFTRPDAHNVSGQAVVALLALAMGLQNAMVRTHGVPDLATNVMTVTFAAIFADSKAVGGDNKNWRRRVLSIGLFVASAAIGALLLQFGVFWPLVLASIVFSVAMIPLLFGNHQSK